MPPPSKIDSIRPDVKAKALEMYYSEGKSISEVQVYLKEAGYDLSKMTVWKLLKDRKQTVPVVEGMVQSQTLEVPEALDHLTNYLTIINDSLDNILRNGVDTEQLPKILLAISEGRKTLEAIERIQAKMPTKTMTLEEQYTKLIELMKKAEVPVEYIEKIADLWDKDASKSS